MSELPEGVPPAAVPEPLESASAVVLRAATGGGWELLLGLRSRGARFMPGHLACPGGRLEPGDLPAESGAHARCATRELLEETGIAIAPRAWIAAGQRVTPPLFPVRFRTLFFVTGLSGEAQPAAPIPSNPENESLRFARAQSVLEEWERGEVKVPPPVLPILRVLADARSLPPAEVAGRISRANEQEERAPRIEFFPGVWMLPVRTATLPPATHTNVWMPGGRRFVIVDPGSAEQAERERLIEVIARRRLLGDEPVAVLLTHQHRDHAAGAPALARALGLPIHAHPWTPQGLPEPGAGVELRPLVDGAELDLGGVRLRALWTPGHAPDHLAFHLVEPRLLIAGDLLSGVSTILVDPDGGDMEAYLASLERMRGLGCIGLLPGHGPPLPATELGRVIDHRRLREGRILRLLEVAPLDLTTLARRVYADSPGLPGGLIERQTLSHLLLLERRGHARREDQEGRRWMRAEPRREAD